MKNLLALLAWLLLWPFAKAWGGELYPSERLSSGMITCLCQDDKGFVWIGTEYGLNKFDGYRFSHYMHHPGDSASLVNNEVTTLHVDAEGCLWVGCSRGLSRYDADADAFVTYRFPDDRRPRVAALTTDAEGTLIIGTAGYGLYTLARGADHIDYASQMNGQGADPYCSRLLLDRRQCLWRSSHLDTLSRTPWRGHDAPGRPTPTTFTSPYGQPLSFIDYSEQALLVVCQRGILSYDYLTGRLADAGFDLTPLGPEPDLVNAVMTHDGTLLLGTASHGLRCIRRGARRVEPVQASPADAALLGQLTDVSAVMEDRHRNLWVGYFNRGLLLMNREPEAFTTWQRDDDADRRGGSTTAIVPDGDGGLYVVAYPGGISHLDPQGRPVQPPAAPDGVRTMHRDAQGRYWIGTETTLYAYDPATGSARAVETFSGRGLTCMADDGRGTLFVGVFSTGLYVLRTDAPGGPRGELLTMDDVNRPGGYLCNNWIKALFTDSHGLLWVCTTNGLSAYNPQDGTFDSLGWNALLEGCMCYSACETANGDIVVSTENGLYRYSRSRNSVELMAADTPLHDRMAVAMVRDAEGTLWMATNKGLWQLSADGQRAIGHLSGNGLQGSTYTQGAWLRTTEGRERLYFGTPRGVTTFCPADVTAAQRPPGRVWLSSLRVNGRSVPTGEGSRYRFGHKENSLEMEFSLLDFRNAGNISYEWRLNGSPDWHPLSEGSNQLVLNELQPGRYKVEVRATDNGVAAEAACRLTVTIGQPWYRTTWAYIAYIIIFIALLGLAVWAWLRRQRRRLEETKMRFLINATHDIRSPLTLIMGAVEKLKDTDGEAVDTISRNAQRLQLLVNQILDERKIDKGQMKLHCQRTELTDFCAAIGRLYDFNARQRHISFTFDHGQAPVWAWVDRTQFDKVVSNLLSNAFKFTPDGGSVTMALSATPPAAKGDGEGGTAVITVTDSGLGFADDKTERFFERFYQGKNSRDLHIDGTGIGLNLSRAITEMHGGTISAQNRKDGHSGAILTVNIPTGKRHLSAEQLDEAEDQPHASHAQRPQHKEHLLVVDDDPEIGLFIEEELGRWYHFDHAANGRDALKMLLTKSYDLVISDVMMPVMDGIALLKNIKQNPQTSHVPVILLTSRSEVDFRLEGLRKGADAYLAKPFQMEELHVLTDNLLAAVRRMRGKFSGALQQEERVENVEVKGNDDVFMDRVMKVINAHLSDPDLTVEMLTREIGISRAQLHRKMKDITGVPTTEFIRNLRLEQAARLIRENKVNITQVAYSVGFNNQTHFSTTFKKHFGVTPSEFARAET